jgi:hypothetical protein
MPGRAHDEGCGCSATLIQGHNILDKRQAGATRCAYSHGLGTRRQHVVGVRLDKPKFALNDESNGKVWTIKDAAIRGEEQSIVSSFLLSNACHQAVR